MDRIRPTTYEAHLLARCLRLEEHVKQLASALAYALPTVPMLQQLAGHNGYSFLGQYTVGELQPSDEALLRGMGPRFTSKYNLARSDEERRQLLDSLPTDIDHHDSGWLNAQLAEYRMPAVTLDEFDIPTVYSFNGKPAKEFQDWLDQVAGMEDLPAISQYEQAIPYLEYTFQDNDEVLLSARSYIFKNPAIENFPDYIVFLPCQEMMGYVVLRTRKYSDGRDGSYLTIDNAAVVRWSHHELKWLVLRDSACTLAQRRAAISQWLTELGYPSYVPVTRAQMQEIFRMVVERIAEQWSENLDKDTVECRRITIANVLELIIKTPSSRWTNDYEFYFKVLAEGLPNLEQGVVFQAARPKSSYDFRFEKTEHKNALFHSNSLRDNDLPVRQYKTVYDLVSAFLSPSCPYFVEDVLREKPLESDDD